MEDPMNMTQLKTLERSRIYRFPGGDFVEFHNVTGIEVRPSGRHRIEMQDGKKAIVAAHWLVIELDTDDWTF